MSRIERSAARGAAAAACLLGIALSAPAQQPDREAPAKEPTRFIGAAAQTLGWHVPAEPAHIAGPIYFVGTKGLGVYLIRTPEGSILLCTGMPDSGPMIEASIRKLGFDPKEIKWLLGCHAHIDHVGGHAYMRKISGAKVAVMDRDQELLESGGKTDFHYGNQLPFRFDPVKADRVLKDGETVELGGVALTARLTAGHTKGSTTWTMDAEDSGKTYKVVFADGTSVNPGYRLTTNPSYPGIGDDYRRTFDLLASLKPDIWLAAHTNMFGFEDKRERAKSEGAEGWVDREGYASFVAAQRAKFEAAAKAEKAEPAK